jgi:predicted GNAT superfamily acetyltransferase
MQHLFHMQSPVIPLPSQPSISVRPLVSQADLDAAVALQRRVWGYSDLEVDSRAMLTVASRFAGQTIGAFDRERLVGFTLGFATFSPGSLHSHRVGVNPDYQNLGVGRKLKLAQREDALARGIATIQWTFDPLQPRNAHFNLVRLGGISRTYIKNLYGVTTSPLHGGLPTDRLLIEWDLQSNRVQRTLAGEVLRPSKNIREIRLPSLACRVEAGTQADFGERLTTSFDEGYAVTGFDKDGDTYFYILEKL